MAEEHILVVDDEPDILSLLVYQLSQDGYRVSTAVSGRSAISTAVDELPDLVILDLMLPGLDGYEVLKTLRENDPTSQIPILLLTARKDEEERVRGFEYGADDYVTKPFSNRELLLRVQALLRRARAEPVGPNRRLSVGPVELDLEAHRAFVERQEIELTPLEFRLLHTLMDRRGRVQSRRQLLEAVWETTADIETRTVDMHVARLRNKLAGAADLLETVRGIGYRFRAVDR